MDLNINAIDINGNAIDTHRNGISPKNETRTLNPEPYMVAINRDPTVLSYDPTFRRFVPGTCVLKWDSCRFECHVKTRVGRNWDFRWRKEFRGKEKKSTAVAASCTRQRFQNYPECYEFSLVVFRSSRGICEDFQGIPKFPRKSGNWRGITVTESTPGDGSRSGGTGAWNSFRPREFRPTMVKTPKFQKRNP